MSKTVLMCLQYWHLRLQSCKLSCTKQAYVNLPKTLKCVSNYRRLSILNFGFFSSLRPCGYDIIEIP